MLVRGQRGTDVGMRLIKICILYSVLNWIRQNDNIEHQPKCSLMKRWGHFTKRWQILWQITCKYNLFTKKYQKISPMLHLALTAAPGRTSVKVAGFFYEIGGKRWIYRSAPSTRLNAGIHSTVVAHTAICVGPCMMPDRRKNEEQYFFF